MLSKTKKDCRGKTNKVPTAFCFVDRILDGTSSIGFGSCRLKFRSRKTIKTMPEQLLRNTKTRKREEEKEANTTPKSLQTYTTAMELQSSPAFCVGGPAGCHQGMLEYIVMEASWCKQKRLTNAFGVIWQWCHLA